MNATSLSSPVSAQTLSVTPTPVRIGVLGAGTVGQGVWSILATPEKTSQVVIAATVARSWDKARDIPSPTGATQTTDWRTVVSDPSIALVVEVMGGLTEAYEAIKAALAAKKHVVTANKDVMATHGAELLALAQANGVQLLFEGAVAGGIPIVWPLTHLLKSNTVRRIMGILNGTTNYMLTQMTTQGTSYADALVDAQAKGYAEADPTNDVGGKDAAYKLAILSNLITGTALQIDQFHVEGITAISAADIAYASELGYVVKLIGLLQQVENAWDFRIHPFFLPKAHPLASVANEHNAIWIEADPLGSLLLQGPGAGRGATASAVCGDVMALVQDIHAGNTHLASLMQHQWDAHHERLSLLPIDATTNRYYLRLITKDAPGVVGAVGTALGNAGVNLDSVVQHGNFKDGTAAIVLITQQVKEAQLQEGLAAIAQQATTVSVASMIRILDT